MRPNAPQDGPPGHGTRGVSRRRLLATAGALSTAAAPARHHDPPREAGWTRWSVPWRPRTPGATELLARATDVTGRRQPDRAAFNTQGHLFDAVVRHPVTVT